jgi:putative nucleotidyltransferase with HDIG domain
MSVAAAGMLVSVLLDMHLAVLVVALLAVQSGLIMNHEIRFTVMTLLSSLVGIMSVGNVRSKSNLPATTAALAGTNLCLVWLLGLLLKDPLPELLSGSAWAVGSAVFAVFLYWFGLLVLERPFGILTHTALLELSAFDRPLLKDLCTVAPGTYAHSIMVGTLAEAGAQAVGADALLCRVAGYYHDIGKMKMPDFFVENQRRGDNVHGRLSASLSALIITAHVRDGVQMAQEARLPVEIRDIIEQHHGTTLISYFYHQALMDCSGETPIGLEERFRYPGPKPQTREAAVVMMADSVEAATRSLEKPSRERLEAEVSRIIQGKIEDHQLDECDLTFHDINVISEAFLHVLAAMMHGRIAYPAALPQNATGKPMEVRRPDLTPEMPMLTLPFIPVSIQPLAGELALADGDNGGQGGAEASDMPQTTPRIVRASGLPYEALPNEDNDACVSDVIGDCSLDHSPPESEMLYGRLATERYAASDADGQPAESSPTPAAGRRPGPRRGKRPVDR